MSQAEGCTGHQVAGKACCQGCGAAQQHADKRCQDSLDLRGGRVGKACTACTAAAAMVHIEMSACADCCKRPSSPAPVTLDPTWYQGHGKADAQYGRGAAQLCCPNPGIPAQLSRSQATN